MAHTWFSPPGNLYISILLRTGQPVARVGELSFLAALAVADTVEALLPRQIRVMLKWPNDVLVSGAKIAGILLEQIDDATIIGIGLNVLEAPSNVSYKTTTIVANGGIASVDGARDILLDRLGRHLSIWREEGFGSIREQWLGRSYPIGAAIRANSAGQAVAGPFRRSGRGRRAAAGHSVGAPADRGGRGGVDGLTEPTPGLTLAPGSGNMLPERP